ncbi:DsrE family protein [Thiohalomonas denitrificans]|uniref:Uncharacterized protein n=1 Tax=Thiohalomonas denitrificans TaxID=415747 RepID=A0A1G5QKD5_9GAMM|nr:DsrE family protein [Thiohalomonas denitrificans]SCZ62217.1 hypothetical protein SAMN03097708_02279 [Thiohalomonas denitrificans]
MKVLPTGRVSGRGGLLTAVLLLVFATSWIPGRAMAADFSDGVVKVVYHADFADSRRFSAMLTSINNMVTHYQNELVDYDVRIVFVAHGIRFLTDDKLVDTPFAEDAELAERRESIKGRLLSLSDRGVKLELCNITRTQTGVSEDKLYEPVAAVPSGVVRLAELQSEGFAYLKAE